MFFLKNFHTIFVVIVYCTRFVSSLTLDLYNLTDSGFFTIKVYENGITKIMIFSTADKPITRICRGNVVIWSALSGESVKCFTYITSDWKGKKLMTIEINNPVVTDMYYLHTHQCNYLYITKEDFEKKFLLLSMPKPKKHSKPRKRKADTDNTQTPKKRGKPRKIPAEPPGQTDLEQQQPPENQQLEPETIQVEMGTDDEDESTDTASGPSDDDDSNLLNESLFGEDVEKLLEGELDDIGLSQTQLDLLFEDTTDED